MSKKNFVSIVERFNGINMHKVFMHALESSCKKYVLHGSFGSSRESF